MLPLKVRTLKYTRYKDSRDSNLNGLEWNEGIFMLYTLLLYSQPKILRVTGVDST